MTAPQPCHRLETATRRRRRVPRSASPEAGGAMHTREMFRAARGDARMAIAIVAVALATSGCAELARDDGMLAVETAAQADLGKEVVKIRDDRDAALVSARVRSLLAKPLTPSSAVQIALLNHRGLQAAFNELGISEAQLLEA